MSSANKPSLPRFVMRSPQLFYGLALIVFLWTVLLGVYDLGMQQPFAATPETAGIVASAKLRVILDGVREAIYICSSGIMFHILLAIWERVGADRGRGAAE